MLRCVVFVVGAAGAAAPGPHLRGQPHTVSWGTAAPCTSRKVARTQELKADTLPVGQQQQAVADCAEWQAGCGRLWQAVAGCGRLWQAVAGSGSLWQSVAVCGRLWHAVCGSLWQSVAGCGRQSVTGCVCLCSSACSPRSRPELWRDHHHLGQLRVQGELRHGLAHLGGRSSRGEGPRGEGSAG
jgi:hypothetical protein